MGRDNFEGEVKYRDTLQSCVQKWLNQTRCCLGCGLGLAQGIMLDVGPDLHGRDNFKGGRGGPL